MATKALTDDDRADIARNFKQVVNMSPAALRKWLGTDDSKSVGMTKAGEKVTEAGSGESVGHHMGEEILSIKGKKAADLTDDDYHAMNKVIGYVHRHSKQRPHGDITDTRWRKSLMNWGHDPLGSK